MTPSPSAPVRRFAGLIVFLPAFALGQLSEPAGSSGYKLLKLDISPRQAALSGAGVALPGSEQEANAAIDPSDKIRLTAGWTSGYSQLDGKIEHVSWVDPLAGGTLFGRLRFQGFDNIPGYDIEDRGTGTYTASTWAAGCGYAHSLDVLLPGLVTGLALHGGMNHVDAVASFAGWTDLGARWTHGEFALGGSVRNWGFASISDHDPETLPLQTQFGGSYTRRLPFDWTVSVLTDARWTIDEEWTLPVGLEARWGMLALRSGWTVGLAESRPSFGVGIQGEAWGVDASMAWHGALGLSPGMSLTAGI